MNTQFSPFNISISDLSLKEPKTRPILNNITQVDYSLNLYKENMTYWMRVYKNHAANGFLILAGLYYSYYMEFKAKYEEEYRNIHGIQQEIIETQEIIEIIEIIENSPKEQSEHQETQDSIQEHQDSIQEQDKKEDKKEEEFLLIEELELEELAIYMKENLLALDNHINTSKAIQDQQDQQYGIITIE